MPTRALAVVQFGQFPDGDLPVTYTDDTGWGTSPARMDAFLGDWPAMRNAASTVDAAAGRVVAGLLRPQRSMLATVTTGAVGEAAVYRLAGTALPDAGDLYAQLGTVPGVERPQRPSASAVQGVAVGLQTPGGTKGIMAVWLDSLQVFFLYQWDGDGTAATVTYSADTPDGTGLIGLRWADGEVQATLNGDPITRDAADGTEIPPVNLPAPADDLEPFVMAYQFGIFADSFGISWAALTETTPALGPVDAPADTPGAPGWSIHAATPTSRPRGTVPADTWTWTWRLNDASELTWTQARPGGPTIRTHTSHAQVRFDGRRLQTGPVRPVDRTAGPDGDLTAKYTATDRVGQLDRQLVYPTSTQAWVDVPLGDVLRDLVGDAAELPGGDTGVRVDPGIVGPPVTLTVPVRDSVRKAIDTAVTLAGGEWWVDRGDVLRWSETGRGGQRAFLADHGGTVTTVTEASVPGSYGNALWVTGSDSAVYRQTTDIRDRPGGRLDLVVTDPDQQRPEGLAARADRMIVDAAAMTPAYTCQMRTGAWSPSKLGPGDVARLVAPVLGVDEWLRVFEVQVTGSGDSAHAVDVQVTFGAPRPDFARRLELERRRLTALERR